jgi:hypothetical protein
MEEVKPSVWSMNSEDQGIEGNSRAIYNDLLNKAAIDAVRLVTNVTDLIRESGVNDETKHLGFLSIPISATSASMVSVGLILRAMHRGDENHKVIDQKDLAQAVAYTTSYLIYRLSSPVDRKSSKEMAALTTAISDALDKILPVQELKIIK